MIDAGATIDLMMTSATKNIIFIITIFSAEKLDDVTMDVVAADYNFFVMIIIAKKI